MMNNIMTRLTGRSERGRRAGAKGGLAAMTGSSRTASVVTKRAGYKLGAESRSNLPGPSGLPSVKDLADWVFFAPASGRIWFDKQRSLLMHANTFGAMRREI